MKIVISPLAQRDLDDAWRHISIDRPRSADQVLARLIEAIGLIASGFVIGPQATLRDGRKVRSWPVPPFRMYYRLIADELQVVRVYHLARAPIERKRRRSR